MMDIKTWTNNNGYTQIDWTAITDVSIFHTYPKSDGSVVFDGSSVNCQQVVQTAHAYNDRVSIAFGGAGLGGYVNNLLNNPSLRSTTENNFANIVTQCGVDAVEIDLENSSYSQSSVTAFVKELSIKLHAKNPNIQVNLVDAGWISGTINIPAVEPYINHLHAGFIEPGQGCNQSCITGFANQLVNKSKIAVGFYLPGDSSTAMLSANLTWAHQHGYGFYFWSGEYAQPYYTVIKTVRAS